MTVCSFSSFGTTISSSLEHEIMKVSEANVINMNIICDNLFYFCSLLNTFFIAKVSDFFANNSYFVLFFTIFFILFTYINLN